MEIAQYGPVCDSDNCSEMSVDSSNSDEAFSDAKGDTDDGDVILAKCDSSDGGSSAESDGEKAAVVVVTLMMTLHN